MTADADREPRYLTGGLIDHHCHGLVRRELDRAGFESLLNEGGAPGSLATTYFDSMLGLAVRRWCAPLLDLDPLAGPDAYLARRNQLGGHEVDRRLVGAAGIREFVVDTGFEPEPICSAEELAGLCGAVSHEVVRLESVGQALLAKGVPASDFGECLVATLQSSTAVGAKSIAAYRVGLELPAAKPAPDALMAALREVRPLADGTFRIAHPVLNGYLAWTAIELGIPLQFHVGYGDSDVDLLDCDPLLLTGFLRATADRGVPILLLHNYPFHRRAGYLAQVFEHVFMDVSLAVHNTGALSRAVIRESLELVPFGKLLFASDAFGLAELYYLGARLFRNGLSAALEEFVGAGEMSDADAQRIAAMIGAGNAHRVYRLPLPPGNDAAPGRATG
jgi:predicted TIM-barrel fold metal-dependent hydrolase